MKKVVLGLIVSLVLLGVAALPARAAPPETWPIVHIVHWGETLSSIARQYGTSVKAIVSYNGIRNPNCIYAGQKLVIPARAFKQPAPHDVYIVRHGDTLSGIAARFGVTVNALVRANGIANPNCIFAGQRLHIPQGCAPCPRPGSYYIVRCGDTLSKIAWRHGTSVWKIAAANHISNPNCIYAGQKLYIP